jgi:ribulose-5-phosphate 4-epimerase/fuculose-1-phosphate aldolase
VGPADASAEGYRSSLAYDRHVSSHPELCVDSREPDFDDPDEARRHRMRRTALAYRLFGAYRWGEQGDGHISARDPERTDCFWLLRYGVPFGAARIADLVLVGPDGTVVDANGNDRAEINITAYNIHWPIHEARPEAVCAAHTHTPYGTPWSANAEPFLQIVQEATAFHERHAVYDGDDVNVQSTDGGKRIAAALGDGHGVILRNHGLLSVGGSVDEAIGWFVMMERVAEVHVKAHRPQPISDEAARASARVMADPHQGWHAFNWALRARVPDPSVVD